MLTGGGGGAAGSVGLAAAAIASGMAEVVVSYMTLQQAGLRRFGEQKIVMLVEDALRHARTEPPASTLAL
jgi:hypothetical protein